MKYQPRFIHHSPFTIHHSQFKIQAQRPINPSKIIQNSSAAPHQPKQNPVNACKSCLKILGQPPQASTQA